MRAAFARSRLFSSRGINMPPENKLTTNQYRSLTLLGTDGSMHVLSDLIGSSPMMIVFVRHFAVSQAAEHVPLLLEKIQKLHGTKTNTIIVGAGSSQAMNNFRKKYSITHQIFRDQKLKTFKAMGLVVTCRPEGLEEEYEIPVSGCIVIGQTGRILYFHKIAAETEAA